MQLCPTVCSYLLLPIRMAAYPWQRNASRNRSNPTVLHTYSSSKVWDSRLQHHLPLVREGTAASYCISVITLTPVLAAYKQKLFYHIQAKGGAMFRNFILFAQPLLYLILLQWTFKLFNSSLSVRILCACEWTARCLVVLGPAGGHTRLQSFCFSCMLSQSMHWYGRCS